MSAEPEKIPVAVFCFFLVFSAKEKSTFHNSGHYKAQYSLVVTADCLTLSLDVRAAVMYVALWDELCGQYGATSF